MRRALTNGRPMVVSYGGADEAPARKTLEQACLNAEGPIIPLLRGAA